MATSPIPSPRTQPEPDAKSRSFSRLVRRIHMYLGLFLAPWLLMYAASTALMNHRDWVQSFYPTPAPSRTPERELTYRRDFPAASTPTQIGEEILRDLGLEGAHRVSGGKEGRPLIIERQHLAAPRRITWQAEAGKLLIEREQFRGPAFLERMHRRRGFQQPYALDDAWGLAVDVAMLAMLFWALSGLWLWWELKPTRMGGTICGVIGLASFGFFLALL